MRKKKRILAAALTAVMVIGLCGSGVGKSVAYAAEELEEVTEAASQEEQPGGELAQKPEEQSNGKLQQKTEEQSKEQSERQNVETPEEYTISAATQNLQLTNISAEVTSPVVPPYNFTVKIGAKAPDTVKVNGINLTFLNKKTGLTDSFQTDFSSNPGGFWTPGETGGEALVDVSLNEYIQSGEYELNDVYFYLSNEETLNYSRMDESGLFEARIYQEEGDIVLGQYLYDGCADFTVENENEDLISPKIRSVSAITEPITTGGVVEIAVDFSEEGSSVKSISAGFSTPDGQYEWFGGPEFEKGAYTGEGALTLRSSASRKLGSQYRLFDISITDYADNHTSYTWDEASGCLIARDWHDEVIGRVDAATYTVSEDSKMDCLEVESARIKDGIDKEQLQAGDSLELIITVKNNTDTERTVTKSSFNAAWDYGEKRIHVYSNEYNSSVTVKPQDTAEIVIPVQINKFAKKGNYRLVSINFVDGQYNTFYDYNDIDKAFQYAVYQDGEIVQNGNGFPYAGEGDYTVAKSDTPDTEAPYVKSVRIVTDNIKAPSKVRMEIKADAGNAKPTQLSLEFRDVELPNNTITISTGIMHGSANDTDLYYSDERQCYVLEGNLLETAACGTYELSNLYITDEAEQSRYYTLTGNGILTDNTYESDSKFNGVTMTVTESPRKDRDFENPVLIGMENIEKAATIPGEIKYKIKAEDMSGVTRMNFGYLLEDNTYVSLSSDKITKEGEYYTCNVKLGKYFREGTYTLQSIGLTDGSFGINTAGYYRQGSTLRDTQNGETVPYSGELDTTLKRKVPDTSIIHISDPELNSKLQALKNGTTATITGMSDLTPSEGPPVLSKEAVKIIKDKKLKVRLIMMDYIEEILFDGAQLTDEMVQDMFFSIGDKWQSLNGVDFGNAVDEAGYGFCIGGSWGTIPLTYRYSVSQEFYETYKDKNIRLGKRLFTERRPHVCEENLKMTAEDGYYYVEAPLAPEMQNGDAEYTISAGTEKFFDYCLEAETWTQSASDEVVKGKEFSYNIRISNDNEETMRNVLVFPEMLNAEDGTEINLAGYYRFEETAGKVSFYSRNASVYGGKVTINEDGDAVISELKPGESLELALTVEIPETLKAERVVMNTYAAVAEGESESDMKVIAFGSDEFKMTLRSPKTVIKGDINEDGSADIDDLMFMLRVVSKRIDVNTLNAEQIQAGDITGVDDKPDGKVDIDDLMKMLRFICKRISSLE